MIDLYILSNDPVTRAGLQAIVDNDDMIRLIGAGDGTDGFGRPNGVEAQPSVVILGEPGSKRTLHDMADRIVGVSRGVRVTPRMIVVSQNDGDDMVIAALRAGVTGYLTRIGSREELLRSIRVVASGGAAFSPAVAGRFSRYFSAMHSSPGVTGLPDLTSRELEILDLLACGMGNRQIARRLFLAEKTVRNYVSRILTKLEVSDRTTAAVRGREAGLGGQDARPGSAPTALSNE